MLSGHQKEPGEGRQENAEAKKKARETVQTYTPPGIRMQGAILHHQDGRTVHSRGSHQRSLNIFRSETKSAGSYLTPVFISYPTSDLTGSPIGFYL